MKSNVALSDNRPESREKGIHLLPRADRDSQMVRQRREKASDFHSTILQGGDDRFYLAPQVDHHEVGVRGNIAVTKLILAVGLLGLQT